MFHLVLPFFVTCLTSSFCLSENLNKNEHLKFEKVQNICKNSSHLCKSNDSTVCAVRIDDGLPVYRSFENSCFLFVDNMCSYFENEFSIISSGTCEDYLSTSKIVFKDNRRVVGTFGTTFTTKLSTKPILREEKLSTLYEVDTAFDFHVCPYSCPNVYSPVCVGVNRGHGPYYKFFTFSSHCAADLYYCKNWREFSPPPGLQEMVKSSQLSWSYCAANRYIQFARFTEMTTSMGHYGWLAGDHSPTHILEPHERRPGYGK